MFDVPSEETFFRRCKEIKVTHLKLEALEVILMHIQEYISRKESVRPRISSTVLRVSIKFSKFFLQITSSGFWAGSPVPSLGREA
jgi:hypothetical protein